MRETPARHREPGNSDTIDLTRETSSSDVSPRRLASTASHQLRGPLAVVRGVLETLVRIPDLDADTRAELIGRALAAEQRQERLIETLLDRREDGRGEGAPTAPARRFRPYDIDLRDAMSRVLRETLTPDERWRVVVDVPEGARVHVDPVALDCVASNLVSNAVAYSPAGSPVEVGAERRNGEIVTVVRDDGPGVALEDRDRIFEPYERSSRVAGVGLGLSIARWAVDASGGRIWVEGEPGSGARFCFTLPAAEA